MKINQIMNEIDTQQADAAWITTPLNIFYFTGYLSEPHERLLALLVTAQGEQVLFCPQLEVDEVKASPFEGTVVGYLDTESPFSKYSFSAQKLLVEAEHLTLKRQRELIQD
jgi:Xaa-Pro dipeptidase